MFLIIKVKIFSGSGLLVKSDVTHFHHPVVSGITPGNNAGNAVVS